MLVAQVEPVGQAVHLERDAGLERDLDHALQVERVRRPVPDQPAGRMAEAAHRRMPHRLGHLARQRRALLALARVEAELHPVELGQHVVGQVERAVAADVDLGAAQDPERRELLVRGGDLLGLAAQRVGVEARDDAHVRRVVADREVLVAELARRERHLEHGRPAVRPGRVAVEVAADVGELDERAAARRGTAPRAAPAGTTARRAPRRRDSSSGASGSGAERLDVRRRSGRAHELRAEARRLGGEELDRNALDGDADRAPLRALDDGDDLRQPRERVEHGPGLARPATTTASSRGASTHRRGSPASSPPSAAAIAAEQLARLGQQRARAAAAPRAPCASRSSSLRSVAGPIPRTSRSPPASAAARNSSDGRHVERAGDLEHPLRPEPDQAAEADQLRPQLALELVELGDPAGLDELLEPRRDPGPDAAQLADAAGADELVDRHGRLADRLRGAAVGAGGVEARAREVEQRGERLEPIRDRRVVEASGHARKSAARRGPSASPRRPLGRSTTSCLRAHAPSPPRAPTATPRFATTPRSATAARRRSSRATARSTGSACRTSTRRRSSRASSTRERGGCVRALPGRAVRVRARLRGRLERARDHVPHRVRRGARDRRADARRRAPLAAARGRAPDRGPVGTRADALAGRAAVRLRPLRPRGSSGARAASSPSTGATRSSSTSWDAGRAAVRATARSPASSSPSEGSRALLAVSAAHLQPGRALAARAGRGPARADAALLAAAGAPTRRTTARGARPSSAARSR